MKTLAWIAHIVPLFFGTYSKYNYKPQHSFYLGPEMKGDTLNIFIQVLFNSDLGPQEKKDHILRVIVDDQ